VLEVEDAGSEVEGGLEEVKLGELAGAIEASITPPQGPPIT